MRVSVGCVLLVWFVAAFMLPFIVIDVCGCAFNSLLYYYCSTPCPFGRFVPSCSSVACVLTLREKRLKTFARFTQLRSPHATLIQFVVM